MNDLEKPSVASNSHPATSQVPSYVRAPRRELLRRLVAGSIDDLTFVNAQLLRDVKKLGVCYIDPSLLQQFRETTVALINLVELVPDHYTPDE